MDEMTVESTAFVMAVGIFALLIIILIIITGCSCERQFYGNNNLTITYVNYTNISQMKPDCDWDAKNLTCENHVLVENKCYLYNCIGNKPTTKRSCGG